MSSAGKSLGLRLVEGGLVLLLVVPVLAGLLRVADEAGLPDLAVLGELAGRPELAAAAVTAFLTGLVATLLSLLLALAVLAADGTRLGALVRGSLPLQLGVPHMALATGLAFLLAPSGWLVRLASPWATGLEVPPQGLAGAMGANLLLTTGLVLKEMPFLLIAALSRLHQLDARRTLDRAAGLGYSRVEAFWKLVAPRLLGQLRLPLLAVLAFAIGNIELGLVLGPSTPPSLPVLTLAWHQDADLTDRPVAAAAALLLLAMILLLAVGGWLVGCIWRRIGERFLTRGAGSPWVRAVSPLLQVSLVAYALMWGLSLVVLVLWSLAGRWRFPEALPGSFELDAWQGHAGQLGRLALESSLIGIVTTLLALLLSLLILELRQRHGHKSPMALVFLPLLLPQLAFYLGLQRLLVELRLDGTLAAVVLTHLVMVLPYVTLILAEAQAALDPRLLRLSAGLGHGPWVTFVRVKLPLLRPALAVATAAGLAVSLALYLPTLLAGAGRYATLALEVVPLASGGDRRLAAATSLVLALLPLLGWALALTAVRRRPRPAR